MLNRGHYGFNAEVGIKGLKPLVNELSAIFYYYHVRYANPTHDTSPNEVLHILGENGCEWLGLDPFFKVIDSNKDELGMPFRWCEGADDVHSPYGEWPWGREVVQHFWFSMVQRAGLLAFGAFLHILGAIPLHGRPIVVDPKDLSGHYSGSQMVVAHPLMYLGDDILDLLSGDALKQGGE